MRKADFSSYTPYPAVNDASPSSMASAIARYKDLRGFDITLLPDDDTLEWLDRAVDAAAEDVARLRPTSPEDALAALDFVLEELEDDWNHPPVVVAVLRNLRRALVEAPATPCHPG